MVNLEFKRNRENFEINLFECRNSKSHYRNIINKDPKQISQVLIDLYLEGYPIEKSIKLFLKRIKNRDWLGL